MNIKLPPPQPTAIYQGVNILSFGYERRSPPAAKILIDVRSMENPHWTVDGLSDEYLNKIAARYPIYLGYLARFIEQSYDEFGPQTVAIGCNAGRHRSVAVAQLLHGRIIPSQVTHLDYRKAPIDTRL